LLVPKAGPDPSPIYGHLGQSGTLPSWNFGKYLLSKESKVLKYFPSKVTPESPELREAIEAALAK
jgi:glutathione peroxidase